ncbi:HD domain-containing protein [Duganella sp. Dugasp56]|uniref:HD domain-containing protein n=1 Tax=Duganella sp. Dugasp56 TaxID=3243046 RepID=UPI0039B07F78
MKSDAIGTYAWSERTKGILSARERRALVGMLFKTQVTELLDKFLGAMGRRQASVEMDRIIMPGTAICKEAEEQAAAMYPEDLHVHCYRTYYLGSLLGQAFGLRWDPEALYVGCLLHDSGLSDTHAAKTADTGFQIVGARVAQDLALRHGWNESQARALYESISLHLNPYLSRSRWAPEVILVKGGAVMDVIGAYRHRIPHQQLSKVHAAYPRTGFKRHIVTSITDTPHAQHTHAHFLCRCGFANMAEKNPLDNNWA